MHTISISSYYGVCVRWRHRNYVITNNDESPSRQQFWCGNVYTTKRRVTLPICAFRLLQSREGVNYALQRLEPFSCPEFGLSLASGASRCSPPQPGTVYLLRYAPPNCR